MRTRRRRRMRIDHLSSRVSMSLLSLVQTVPAKVMLANVAQHGRCLHALCLCVNYECIPSIIKCVSLV